MRKPRRAGVVYHGTPHTFARLERPTQGGAYGTGFYFAAHPAHAGCYAGDVGLGAPNIWPVRLAISHVFDMDDTFTPEQLDAVAATLQARGEIATAAAVTALARAGAQSGDTLYYALSQQYTRPDDALAAMRALGFDGLTFVMETPSSHTPRNQFGQPVPNDDRVWVVFDPQQIHSPFFPRLL